MPLGNRDYVRLRTVRNLSRLTCYRKRWVFFFPQPGRRLPFWPEIDLNAYETKDPLHFRPESALTGLAAGRRPGLEKWGWFFFPTPILVNSSPRI